MLFYLELLKCIDIRRVLTHEELKIEKMLRIKDRKKNTAPLKHNSYESFSHLIALTKSIVIKSRETRRALMSNQLLNVLIKKCDSEIIHGGIIYRTINYDNSILKSNFESEDEHIAQALADQHHLYYIANYSYNFIHLCRHCLSHVDEVGVLHKNNVLSGIPPTKFVTTISKSCLQFGKLQNSIYETHKYHRRSGNINLRASEEHCRLMTFLHESEIECALLLWHGAKSSDVLRESIGSSFQPDAVVSILHSVSKRNITLKNHNNKIEAIVGLCRLLSFILLDERRLKVLLNKSNAILTANMMHHVFGNIILRSMKFYPHDVRVMVDNNNSNYVAIVSNLSRTFGRILKFVNIQSTFLTISSHHTIINLEERLSRLIYVMAQILKSRVRRVPPLKYVRLADRVLDLDHANGSSTTTITTKEPQKWHSVRQTLDKNNFTTALHHYVAKHKESKEQEYQRRMAGFWKPGKKK